MPGRASQIDARSMPGQSLAASNANIDAKIEPKSVPAEVPGHPKSSQNRSRDPLGMPRGAQERPGGILGASQERLGASLARPGSAQGASKGAPGGQKGRLGAPGSAPRRPKSIPSRVRKRKNRVYLAQRIRKAPSERFFIDFCRFSGFLQSLRTLESTAPASKNRGSALRAAS